MCGVTGVFHHRSQVPAERDVLERMTASLFHRGPDQSGIFMDRELGLGHRRLSIIDLSEAGRQPMANEDGNVVVSFNGEIYNYREIRSELQSAGHIFRSNSDTEVLVHLWEDRRTGMVERLEGMFAFALFDRRTRELLLARDRLGEKPLYWAPVRDGIVFASEIKAIAEVSGVDLSVDLDSIAAYLGRQYVPAPGTAYRGVRALEAATFVLFQAGREPARTCYWEPRPRGDLPATPAAREELVAYEIDRTIRSRMVAEVPVGCFLSSGVDSSLVAHGMQQATGSQVETFSVGFAERGYDESRESSQLADALGVKHRVQILEPPTFESLQSILQRYDQPFGDSAAIPTFFLSRVARERVTVVLSGDGGDEVFGGYERYRLMLLAGLLSRAPGVRRMGSALLSEAGPSRTAGRILGRALVVAASRRVGAYASLMAPFDPESLRSWMVGTPPVQFLRETAIFDSISEVTEAAQICDLTTYLPGCLTTKVDIASMAHSLEVRAPFLDHRLVEIGLALPRKERVRLGRTKVLLRRIAAGRVGSQVAGRRKRGFSVPLEIWLRGRMREEAAAYLLGDQARMPLLVDRTHLIDETRRFFDGDRSLYFRVWTLLALEAWLRSPLGRRAVS
jgi:asparagine synthase (glutamine-hydrolysing)